MLNPISYGPLSSVGAMGGVIVTRIYISPKNHIFLADFLTFGVTPLSYILGETSIQKDRVVESKKKMRAILIFGSSKDDLSEQFFENSIT